MARVDTGASAYVSFYRRYGISPVSQDISDLQRHFRRRRFLYGQIGLAPRLLAGRSILEFGPGSGHNSLYTLSCDPGRYVLVDANERALADLRELLAPHLESGCIEIVGSFFEDFVGDREFDVVLAEGCIPSQVDPPAILRKIAEHVTPGGILVITCASVISGFSEIVRRLFRDRVMAPDAPADEQLQVLRPIVVPHVGHLPGMSRPLDDWILDNIIQPFIGSLMSIEDAVHTLSDRFDFYGSSPRFLTDLRWYKDAIEPDALLADAVVNQSHGQAINLLDHRLNLPPVDPDSGRELHGACSDVWNAMQAIESAGSRSGTTWDMTIEMIARVADLVDRHSSETSRAIREAAAVLEAGDIGAPMPAFAGLWGRGQQYLSFTASSR